MIGLLSDKRMTRVRARVVVQYHFTEAHLPFFRSSNSSNAKLQLLLQKVKCVLKKAAAAALVFCELWHTSIARKTGCTTFERGGYAQGKPQTQKNAARPPMQQVFIEGGVIRKLWSVETHAYRDHLLRLDAESRRSRFCGAIADDMVRNATPQPRAAAMSSSTASSWTECCAAPPICALSGRSIGARRRPPSASRSSRRRRRCRSAVKASSEYADICRWEGRLGRVDSF